MRSTILLPLLATLATAAPTTSHEALVLARSIVARAPVEAKAVLKSVTSSGTGCASNSAAFIFQDNATIAFDALVAEPAAPTKACRITVDVQVDPKWKYIINKQSTAQGYADGGAGTFSAVYTVNGKKSESKGEIKGSGNWMVNLKQDGATSAYGGGVATIDVSVALASGSSGYATVDSLDIIYDYST